MKLNWAPYFAAKALAWACTVAPSSPWTAPDPRTIIAFLASAIRAAYGCEPSMRDSMVSAESPSSSVA